MLCIYRGLRDEISTLIIHIFRDQSNKERNLLRPERNNIIMEWHLRQLLFRFIFHVTVKQFEKVGTVFLYIFFQSYLTF